MTDLRPGADLVAPARRRSQTSAVVIEPTSGPIIKYMGDAVFAAFIAFTMDRRTHRGRLLISPQAFRRLAPQMRTCFHRHTPPVVYVARDAAR